MVFLARLYAKRIVNVNVNILVAGALAMMLTLIPVHLSHQFISEEKHFLIVGITFLSDLIFDVVIYYGLHWLANHMPWRKGLGLDDPDVTRPAVFFRDATRVQAQRAVLSPILYTIFLGLQYYLLKQGVTREWAAVAGLTSGILFTRVVHTVWMLKADGRASAASPASGASGTLTGKGPSIKPGSRDKERIEGAA